MIYITGDTHSRISSKGDVCPDTQKLLPSRFPESQKLGRDDFLIIAGDFGGVWYGGEKDRSTLNFFDSRPYTTLFVDGNHENFSLLNSLPVEMWHGGKVHRVSDSIIHLMRGQIYEIEGKTFFTFGGGVSIDKWRRTEGVSWWPEEWPSWEECSEALGNMDKAGWKVDYIITHAAPEIIVRQYISKIQPMMNAPCKTEQFLETILDRASYTRWFCGHYHIDHFFRKFKTEVLYRNIIKLSKGYPTANRSIV